MQSVKLAMMSIAVCATVSTALAQYDTVEVPNDYLIWLEGFDYRTEIRARLTLNDVFFKGTLKRKEKDKERIIEGEQATAFAFSGSMLYDTSVITPGQYSGSANRDHLVSEITKLELALTKPRVEVGASVWDKFKSWFDTGIPAEFKDDYEIFRREKSGVIVIKPKANRPPDSNNVLATLSPDFGKIQEAASEYIPAFSKKKYTLEWSSPDVVKKAKMKVTPKEGLNISKDVRDLIAREARLLYTSILQAETRADGEEWLVHAEDLDAMIHSSVEGKFRGRVGVRASRIDGKIAPGTGTPITGWKLEFIPNPVINTRTYHSDIRFVCTDNSGKSHNVQLEPIGSRFTGELWLDSEHQMVRYGRMNCDNAPYEGKMPKIATLNLELDSLTAKINFLFTYFQSVSPKEEGE